MMMNELTSWTNFYVIVGTSAGALVGLQFVLITLIASRPVRDSQSATSAFATPTVVHFFSALVLAAILTAPWRDIMPLTAVCATLGVAGVLYSVLVIRRMRKQIAYKPEMEDWVFHAVLPMATYVTVTASAATALSHIREGLFGFGASALLLLAIGIHNAWDAATYHVAHHR